LGISSPALYTKGAFYGDILPFHASHGNELFISWRVIDSIYVYDLNTGLLTKKVPTPIPRKLEFRSLDLDELSSSQFSDETFNSLDRNGEFYTQVGVFKDESIIWRIAKLKPDALSQDNRFPIVFGVYDMDGKVLFEQKMPPMYRLITTSKDLYFFNRHEQNPNYTLYHFIHCSIDDIL
jgi:hypothetical protein